MVLHNMTGSRTINERQVGAAYSDIISARIRRAAGTALTEETLLSAYARAEDAIYHSSVKTTVTVRRRDAV